MCVVAQEDWSHSVITNLDDIVASSYLLDHDFFRCFRNGEFHDMEHAASIFADNHFKYSSQFSDYLQIVADKFETWTPVYMDDDYNYNINPDYDNMDDNCNVYSTYDIKEPLLKEMREELGQYEIHDIAKLAQIGLDPSWYYNIPHKFLSQRLFESLPRQVYHEQQPGDAFTLYMTNLYQQLNPCESLAVISFGETGEVIRRVYQDIWTGLKLHTELTGDVTVIFPLHAVIDDTKANLIKTAFAKYLLWNAKSCNNVEQVVRNVLQRRIQMYHDIRLQIERVQNYACNESYWFEDKFAHVEIASNNHNNNNNNNNIIVENMIENIPMSNANAVKQQTDMPIKEASVDSRIIAIIAHIVMFLVVLLRD